MHFGFIGSSYTPYSISAESQRTVNLFPESIESGQGKDRIALYGSPGLTTLLTPTLANLIKAIYYDTATARMFAVTRRTDTSLRLIEFNLTGVETDRGQLLATGGGTEPASISSNGSQLFVVCNNPSPALPTAHILNFSTNVLTNVTSLVAAGQPVWSQFLDSRFIALGKNGKIYLSALNDGLTWDATKVATPESSPDTAKTILADHGELRIFADESVEVWFNSGNQDFAFEVNRSATIQEGILYRYSVATIAGRVFWVGRGREGRAVVYGARGYQPERVSNHAVEASLQNKSVTGAVPVAWVRQIHGHPFYVLTFPDDGLTWEYDTSLPPEMGWHELSYLNGSTEEAHRGRCAAFVGGEEGAASGYVVGDRGNGKIYTTSMSVYTDAGDPIRRERRTRHLSEEMKRNFYAGFRLDLEPLAGTFSVAISDDGGLTFGSEITGTALYSNAVRQWLRLGSSRNRVFRVRSTAIGKHVWLEGYLDPEPLLGVH